MLITIGIFDLVTTIALLRYGMHEGNPFFSRFAEQGAVPLAFAKFIFLAGPIALLEIARKYSPKSAEQGMWVAAGCYFMLYALHLMEYVK